MITLTGRRASLVLDSARWCKLAHIQRLKLSPLPSSPVSSSAAALVFAMRSFQTKATTTMNVKTVDRNGTLLQHELDKEFSTLKINWFPGHMVKATKVIREKLKQVDMVFEVRDARIPFSSANDDLDKIVGPSKARLVVLNKADLANPSLEQRVVQRFLEQGKTAIYVCGRTGTNINKLLAWARESGAKRGEFSTAGAVGMVVGMPNVGKSSLINFLRGNAFRKERKGGGVGEEAKQVARIGAMPGVTRQVSAFRIASNPPLFLVDTPGVMVPHVNNPTTGLFLALTRAVPDFVVQPDVLVSFMLRIVRARRTFGTAPIKTISPEKERSRSSTASKDLPKNNSRRRDARVSKSVEAWLLKQGTENQRLFPQQGGVESESPLLHLASSKTVDSDADYDKEKQEFYDGMEALLEAVDRESGAEGKSEEESRRIQCQFLLDAFRDGQFGRMTLDSVPRVHHQCDLGGKNLSNKDSTTFKEGVGQGEETNDQHQQREGANEINMLVPPSSSSSPSSASPQSPSQGERKKKKKKGEFGESGKKKIKPGAGSATTAESTGRDEHVADILGRDWSNPSAWEIAEAGSRP